MGISLISFLWCVVRDSFGLKAGLTFFSLAIALTGAEFVVRVAKPIGGSMTGPVFEFDPVVQFRNRVDLETDQVFNSKRTAIRTNSQGFRQDEQIAVEKAKGTKRVLCLGDSFLFGMGIAVENTYFSLLQAKIKEAFPSTPIQMLNTGVGGYGQQQELALLESRGFKFEPDAVVMFMGPNDVQDNVESPLYVFDKDGKLVKSDKAIAKKSVSKLQHIANHLPFYGYLSTHSSLFALIRYAVMLATRPAAERKTATSDAKPAEAPPIAAKAGEFPDRITKGLILEMARLCRERGIAFAVVELGGYGETYAFIDSSGPWFKENNIPLMNVWSATRERGPEVSIPGDGHFNEFGNQLVANAMWPGFKSFLSESLHIR